MQLTNQGRSAVDRAGRLYRRRGELLGRRKELRLRAVSWLDKSLMVSQPCTYESMVDPTMLRWATTLRPDWERLRPGWDSDPLYAGATVLPHRKVWEWAYIAEALERSGSLQPGRRGVGFGVGKEPLTALFASRGAEVVATDLQDDLATAAGWRDHDEFAGALEGLNERGICDPDEFRARVSYRSVDMREVPDDLTGFDFSWSSCAFEHLGSLDAGIDFVVDQMKCVRPGGVSVHTTEYNVVSNDDTIDHGGTVLYRWRDLMRLCAALHAQGHRVKLDFTLGQTPTDQWVDFPPFCTGGPHLKMALERYVTTSYGLTIRKGH
jgi:hypothetical protein